MIGRGSRAASSGASKKSRKNVQGSQLPPDRSTIDHYPVGSCVLIEVDGEPGWHMLLYRIGGSASPHCGRMSVPPQDLGWNAGLRETREIRSGTVVVGSCWPLRADPASSGSGAEQDPLAADGPGAAGTLMLSHLMSIR